MSTREKVRKRTTKYGVRKAIKIVFRTIFWIAVGVVGFFGYKAYEKYKPIVDEYRAYAQEVVAKSSLEDFRAVQTSYIYDSDGGILAKLKTDKDINYVKYDKFPKDLVNAVVAIEDKRFWEHDGVDWQSTAAATYLYVKNPSEITRGGSTITQQLVKNIYLTNEKSIERKAKEIFIALELEKQYSKKQIIEFYLNNINYSNGYYGIGAAAKGYFSKKVNKLSLEEIAFLCAIPNNPTYYDPINNIKNTTRRRNLILSEMYTQGYLTEEEYLIASNSPIHFDRPVIKNHNFMTSYAIDCSVRFLMKKNDFNFNYSFKSSKEYSKYRKRYAEAYDRAKEKLYTGGYKIYTSIDRELQSKVQEIVNRTLKDFRTKAKNGIYELQGAVTVIDNSTGKVLAIVGGRSQNFNGIITFNRGYQSYRQPGSTIKPLIVYTPALEAGYTPESSVNDEYTADGPKNSDGVYSGVTTLRNAVERSKNVVAWNLFNSIGPRKGLSYAQRMNFNRIVPSDYYLSSALGGLTYGVTTVEMASGYRTLANDGVFNEPTCITSVKLSEGLHLDLDFDKRRVYSEDSARVMTDVLQGVAKNGTARGLTLGTDMPIACKTGTTNNQTNGWFCGYTPYYTVACYVGYDESKSLSGLWGSTYPMSIWRQVQTYLCKHKKVIAFKKKRIHKPTVTSGPSDGLMDRYERDVYEQNHPDDGSGDGSVSQQQQSTESVPDPAPVQQDTSNDGKPEKEKEKPVEKDDGGDDDISVEVVPVEDEDDGDEPVDDSSSEEEQSEETGQDDVSVNSSEIEVE